MHHQISARWCNGSTTDSGSVCLGSSPGRAAISCVSRKILIVLSSVDRNSVNIGLG